MIKALFLDFYGTLAQEDARRTSRAGAVRFGAPSDGIAAGRGLAHRGLVFQRCRGAAAVGIPAVWLNRRGKPAPGPCRFVPSLRVLLTELPS